MISPAGLVVRNDRWGSGHFHASRDGGKRLHSGVDLVILVGQRIVAPEDCSVVRLGIVYDDVPHYNLIVLRGQLFWHKIMYVKSSLSAGVAVKCGEPIGYSQDVSVRYDSRMAPHIHWEVCVKGFNKAGGSSGVLINPSEAVKL